MKQVEAAQQDLVIGSTRSKGSAEATIYKTIDNAEAELRQINLKIFDNPELGFEEFQAHDNIVAFLRSLGFVVTPHAYGVETSFAAEYGNGGRVVTYNAEYDALPGIGHACGHNLIATASIASFLAVAAALKESGLSGRVRLLGTPAEEGGGGKINLIQAGAYEDVDACLMIHPAPIGNYQGKPYTGKAWGRSLAMTRFNVVFKGRPAHAAAAPYQGINALDAVVLAYNGVSMLRQQMREYDRVHSAINDGGNVPNVITSITKTEYCVRSATRKEVADLKRRVVNCFEGAALATGCSVEYEDRIEYADLRPNKPLCSLYAETMGELGMPVECTLDNDEAGLGSTDQGNVTYECPGFHGTFDIQAPPNAGNHTHGFTAAAGTVDAHKKALATAKGMAVVGWKVLSDDSVATKVKNDFEADRKLRDAMAVASQ